MRSKVKKSIGMPHHLNKDFRLRCAAGAAYLQDLTWSQRGCKEEPSADWLGVSSSQKLGCCLIRLQKVQKTAHAVSRLLAIHVQL